MKNAKINPGDRGPLRKAAEYEAQLEREAQAEADAIVAEVKRRAECGDHVTELSAEGPVTT